jgi:hypothetical protein
MPWQTFKWILGSSPTMTILRKAKIWRKASLKLPKLLRPEFHMAKFKIRQKTKHPRLREKRVFDLHNLKDQRSKY